MSEPTDLACPQCGTPRAADGTPACSCGRRASDAHIEARTAEAAAAEDFDPLRIRPFVEVGDGTGPDDGPPAPAAPDAAPADGTAVAPEGSLPSAADEKSVPSESGPSESGPSESGSSEAGPSESESESGPSEAGSSESGLSQAPAVAVGSPVDGRRRRRRVVLVSGAGATAAVLVTGCLVGGLLAYRSPSRDGSPPEGVRASVPEATSRNGTSSDGRSPGASSAPPSGAAASSPTAAPAESQAAPTGSTGPSGLPSGAGPTATATAAPAPGPPDGQDPVLRRGDTGPEVTELQLRLRQIGFYDGDADGEFDRRVENAVRGYQLTRFVLDDEPGVYGTATRASLESETSQP
ncbi:peptidoglycan-binding protein [Streptomyces sp. NPDC014995]|uniref:peptidoglycan-binding domain-containing protein n=1 Tax=Streptomyces sp. NPDC014995 TaxID=3364936 RepID=UPI003700D191